MEQIFQLISQTLAAISGMSATDWLEVSFTATAIVGNEFVIRRDHRGYYFWLVANFAGIILFLTLHRYGACILYAYYTVSCVRGLRNWKKLTDVAPVSAKHSPAA